MDITNWKNKWNSFRDTPTAKMLFRVLKTLFLIGLITYILFQLNKIGIKEVLSNLPINPLFYLLFVLIYLSLPLWEILIYKIFWKFKFKDGIRPFITKKIFNAEVVGYSGEVYLYSWAKKKFNLPNNQLFGPIKDNAILSSVVSNITILIVLLIFTLTTDIDIFNALNLSRDKLFIIVGVLLSIVLILILFRKNVFSIKSNKLWKVVGLHEARILCTYSLELLQWSIVMPGIPFQVWFTLLAVKIVTSRLPFVPNQDLIFAGLGIELSRLLNVSSAGIAGLLLTNSALLKVTNLTLYSLFQLKGKLKSQSKPEVDIDTTPTSESV